MTYTLGGSSHGTRRIFWVVGLLNQEEDFQDDTSKEGAVMHLN